MADPKTIKHGTYGAYINYGCRCDECRAANAAYARAWRAKNRVVRVES